MTAVDLLNFCAHLGVALSVEDGRLRIHDPQHRVTAKLRYALVHREVELSALLTPLPIERLEADLPVG